MTSKGKSWVIFAAIFAAIFIVSCNQEVPYREAEGVIWNTNYHITYKCDRNLVDSILAALRDVEMSLSPFQRGSLISAINRNESDSTDRHIDVVLRESQRVNKISEGAFDPTVSPLINLWGFGFAKSDAAPDKATIDSCLRSVGINECSIEDGAIRKKSAATQFNFSAITKGYGCDEVGRMLERNGCVDYLIEIGGELAIAGKNPRGEKWRVMVDAPIDDNAEHQGLSVVEVTDCGIATSGNYRNYRDTENGRIAHTISPVTGMPVATTTLSATVIAPTTMAADALATACMAMEVEDAVRMIEGEGGATSAMLIVDEGGDWKIVTAGPFPK